MHRSNLRIIQGIDYPLRVVRGLGLGLGLWLQLELKLQLGLGLRSTDEYRFQCALWCCGRCWLWNFKHKIFIKKKEKIKVVFSISVW